MTRLTLDLSNQPGDVRIARVFVASVLRAGDFGAIDIADVRLVVSEIMTGMVETDSGGSISIDLEVDIDMRRAQIDIVASSGSRGRGVDDLLTAAGPGVEPIDSGWSVAVGSR